MMNEHQDFIYHGALAHISKTKLAALKMETATLYHDIEMSFARAKANNREISKRVYVKYLARFNKLTNFFGGGLATVHFTDYNCALNAIMESVATLMVDDPRRAIVENTKNDYHPDVRCRSYKIWSPHRRVNVHF